MLAGIDPHPGENICNPVGIGQLAGSTSGGILVFVRFFDQGGAAAKAGDLVGGIGVADEIYHQKVCRSVLEV